MKTLELSQMENLQGGDCGADLLFAGIALAALAITPVGWTIGFGLAALGWGTSGANVILGGNCM